LPHGLARHAIIVLSFPLAGRMTAFGKATAQLLVVVLLGCPYFCLSSPMAVGGTPAAGERKCSPCGCCCQPASQGGEERPSQPDSCTEIGTCLCHGAVMDRHVDVPNPEQTLVTFLQEEAGTQAWASPAVELGTPATRSACHFPAADSGREVRALIASLLI
jgi:hypothetical protein